MKFLESRGIPKNNIIDGIIFKMHELDFQKLIDEGIAYGVLTKYERNGFVFHDGSRAIYPRVYVGKVRGHEFTLKLGRKSYFNPVGGTKIETVSRSELNIGDFTAIAWDITFELGLNAVHNPRIISQASTIFGWNVSEEFLPKMNDCKINIGNDVWIGRGCILKNTNPDKPLKIGDGAVVASDSVVVKNVPPYAIVGGNPAKIIKYRFPEKIIEALLRIKWWDWDLDKIHDNFKYFNRVEEFVAMHDKGV